MELKFVHKPKTWFHNHFSGEIHKHRELIRWESVSKILLHCELLLKVVPRNIAFYYFLTWELGSSHIEKPLLNDWNRAIGDETALFCTILFYWFYLIYDISYMIWFYAILFDLIFSIDFIPFFSIRFYSIFLFYSIFFDLFLFCSNCFNFILFCSVPYSILLYSWADAARFEYNLLCFSWYFIYATSLS